MTQRALNLPILISLVVGNMIGTGIYVLPASLAQFGTISIFAWVYTSVGAIFLALTFAHLNRRHPKTGGPYAFCREAYGRAVGCIVAYMYWLSNIVSIAGISVASISYLGFITNSLNANSPAYQPYTALSLEIAAVWAFTFINIAGIHLAGMVQVFITILKVTPLILISLLGLGYIHTSNLQQFTLGNHSYLGSITSAATLTFWAFIGLESATVPAESTKGSKDVYKATVLGTLITSTVYILSTIVLMGMISVDKLKSSQFPFADAATILFGPASAYIISLCAVISGLGALNACILIQGQIVYAAARDRLLPRVFSQLSDKDAPVAGQAFSSSIVTLFLILTLEPTLLKQFNDIALLAGLLTLIVYFMTSLAEVKFAYIAQRSKKRALSTALVIALLAALYAIWMISSFQLKMLVYAVVLFVVPIPLYFLLVE